MHDGERQRWDRGQWAGLPIARAHAERSASLAEPMRVLPTGTTAIACITSGRPEHAATAWADHVAHADRLSALVEIRSRPVPSWIVQVGGGWPSIPADTKHSGWCGPAPIRGLRVTRNDTTRRDRTPAFDTLRRTAHNRPEEQSLGFATGQTNNDQMLDGKITGASETASEKMRLPVLDRRRDHGNAELDGSNDMPSLVSCDTLFVCHLGRVLINPVL